MGAAMVELRPGDRLWPHLVRLAGGGGGLSAEELERAERQYGRVVAYLAAAIRDIFPERLPDGFGELPPDWQVMAFNDAGSTSDRDVRRVFEGAIALATDADGPEPRKPF
jgi:hypothetical protein